MNPERDDMHCSPAPLVLREELSPNRTKRFAPYIGDEPKKASELVLAECPFVVESELPQIE